MNKIILTLAFSLIAVIGFSQQSSNAGWEVGYEDNSSSDSNVDNALTSNSGNEFSISTGEQSPEELAIGPGTPVAPIDQYTTLLLVLGGLMMAGFAVTKKSKLENA